MKNIVRQWLAAPCFAGDDEKTQRAGLLNVVVLASLGFTVISILAIVSGTTVPLRTALIVLLWLALLMQSRRWLHAGKLAYAEWVLTAGFFITITAVNISQGTVRAPATAIYVFWVTLAVMIYRLRGLLIAATLSSLAVLCLIFAENRGWLPAPDLRVGVTQWVVLTGLFFMTATLAHFISLTTSEALRQSRNENRQRMRAEAELRKLTRVVEQSPNSIVITDLNATIEYVNPRFFSITGFTPDEVIGKNPRLMQSGRTPRETYRELWRTLMSGREWRGEFVNKKKDGTLYCEAAMIAPITNSAGAITHYLAVKQDITEQKRAEEALQISEERHRLIANFARDVIWTMQTDGKITSMTHSVEALRGMTPEEAMRETLEEKLTPASKAVAQQYLAQLHADMQAGQVPQAFRGELEYRCKDGSTVWTDVMVQPVLSKDGGVIELLGVTRSIAEHKRLLHELQAANEAAERANAELLSMATTDVLTGIWNRRHFEEIAATAMAQAQRYQHPVSMLLFDIDHFKAVNDRYGHQVGDQVLVELTRVVSQALRNTDILARWGGEEFVLILSHCDESAALQLAEKIRKAVQVYRFPVAGSITISLGVAQFSAAETLDAWFGRADHALFDAKHSGRNKVCCSPKPAA